jgi:hypothetical protein
MENPFYFLLVSLLEMSLCFDDINKLSIIYE